MSNAVAQSATELTKTNNGEQNFDFALSTKNAAARQSKGVTRERQMLNRQKLISAVCADYRTHFAAIYGKTERLPSEIFAKIDEAVDAHLATMLATVNHTNVISHRRAFYHNSRDLMVTERVTNTGENMLTLQEQHLGIVIFITNAERKLKALEAKPTPDLDAEREVKASLMKLNITKQFIEGEIKTQSELKK
jgi:hypothetical protein